MAFSSSKISPQPGFGRRLLAFQWIYLIVAIGLFAIVWITDWSHANFFGVLVYSFATGNLMLLAAVREGPRTSVAARRASRFGCQRKAGITGKSIIELTHDLLAVASCS